MDSELRKEGGTSYVIVVAFVTQVKAEAMGSMYKGGGMEIRKPQNAGE